MKSCTAKKLIAILKAHGFSLVRQKGSHMIWKNTDGIIVPVPLHGTSKPIPIGTLLSIIKQSKIPKEKFH
ncbi:MAG: hypothetical protein A3J54_00595 [Candidatus Ryanbacteria bacterium RIFCSPHIGHO2_02_FULL_45_13b]|uniref:Addiction module toxin, HicA family n=1 Tax=Candidatus Ryanbacteria bacterium RIFCSPHIGHO2_02_FULL_45_13b TaxID=1802117 RepID=A0A1G2G4E5_9BACT|nr:MAG: hypothetical protein A3J54_00595 [Candidatus Ryanbacteria bacterium RIFCSPHIGHO2_02_FULL_45_13b]